jgi:hypothetical protein
VVAPFVAVPDPEVLLPGVVAAPWLTLVLVIVVVLETFVLVVTVPRLVPYVSWVPP